MVEYEGGKFELEIELKYFDGELVICMIEWVFKLGCCVYLLVKNILYVFNGLGVLIILILCGVMSDYQVWDENVGGEVLCCVF